MDKRKTNGTICVFLALVFLLIMSLILVFLESANKAASKSYAQILLKTATGSVLGEYYGPLFADYDIFAIDSGFGNKKGDASELKRRLEKYMGDNVWNYYCEDIQITDMDHLLDETGEKFFAQVTEFEKYAVAEEVLEEIFSRIKNIGDQKTITKIMEKKMGIEDELAIIDKKTLELMKLIDGVNLTLGSKTASLIGYDIEPYFIKKFWIGENTMADTGINNPSVYAKLKDKYLFPIQIFSDYEILLNAYSKKLLEIQTETERIDELRTIINDYNEKLSELESTLNEKNTEAEDLENEITDCKNVISKLSRKNNKKNKETRKKKEEELANLEIELDKLKNYLENIQTQIEDITNSKISSETEIDELEIKIADKKEKIDAAGDDIKKVSDIFVELLENTMDELNEVCKTVDDIAKKQEKIKPLVEDFETLLRTIGPVLDDDLENEFKETLEYMKAYVGFGNNKITSTDFDSIKKTAEYDIEVLSNVDFDAFGFKKSDSFETISDKLSRMSGADKYFEQFSYTGFTFDYSEIKESVIENKLVEEFENNISEGYLSLFLPSGTKLSDNSLLSELLPSIWYEVEKNDEEPDINDITDGADDKGGGELLNDADEGSGISDIADLLSGGLSEIRTKLLAALYMRQHFKSFRNKKAEGDTVLDYELEYILSGFETDKANLSAAATKIMLLRLAICTIYTLTQKELKAQAQALAISIMGFTGLPFLITIVKYLVLFLWAAAQAVIETAAIMRGKKVAIIPDSKSFCLSLHELPLFAGLVSEKADKFSESEVYLDYDDYLLILLLLQGSKTQAARTMDIIQENIRYKYNDDFLLSNAVTSFSCKAIFKAPYKYMKFTGLWNGGSAYDVEVNDIAAY